ncbi:MAG: glycerophosphoryl diester phosphodiesterase [Gammaproteobacteria bacterium]|jgi:glycerophosphoryl diester phosphodiesterase
MRKALLNTAQRAVDLWFAAKPEQKPTVEKARQAKVVAHRGNCGLHSIENTLAAFHDCDSRGVWGIELDIQWTRDGMPVVSHDVDCERVFGIKQLSIAENNFEFLQKSVPLMPAFEEVLNNFGSSRHLMIELKRETLQPQHFQHLRRLLSNLSPGEDYHLLALEFDLVDQIPVDLVPALMMVAETNYRDVLKGIYQRNWPACSGHYLLFNKKIRYQLEQANKNYGVGFIKSKNALYREIRLGSHWIFTNHAGSLQSWLDELL